MQIASSLKSLALSKAYKSNWLEFPKTEEEYSHHFSQLFPNKDQSESHIPRNLRIWAWKQDGRCYIMSIAILPWFIKEKGHIIVHSRSDANFSAWMGEITRRDMSAKVEIVALCSCWLSIDLKGERRNREIHFFIMQKAIRNRKNGPPHKVRQGHDAPKRKKSAFALVCSICRKISWDGYCSNA